MPKPHRISDDARHPPVSAAVDPRKTEAFDSRRWTGDVDEQQAEAKVYLVGIIAGVAILAPLVLWIGRAVSRAIGL
jgi:hypothetical protein